MYIFVNAMKIQEIVNRVKKIILHYELSAATFADKIGVQRSSISHLLKGRNKPSLDFILKVIEAFPDVDLNWLLFGNGSFLEGLSENQEPSSFVPIEKNNIDPGTNTKEKEIDRIVVLYKDGTFKTYRED